MSKNIIVALSFLVCGCATAQEPIQQLFSALRPICSKVVEKDMVRDMAKFSSVPVTAEKVCDCANERLVEDPHAKRFADLTKEERRALPKAAQMSMYLSAKYYSAALTCYADAVRISADHIDVTP